MVFWFRSNYAFCYFIFCDCLSILFRYMVSLSCKDRVWPSAVGWPGPTVTGAHWLLTFTSFNAACWLTMGGDYYTFCTQFVPIYLVYGFFLIYLSSFYVYVLLLCSYLIILSFFPSSVSFYLIEISIVCCFLLSYVTWAFYF